MLFHVFCQAVEFGLKTYVLSVWVWPRFFWGERKFQAKQFSCFQEGLRLKQKSWKKFNVDTSGPCVKDMPFSIPTKNGQIKIAPDSTDLVNYCTFDPALLNNMKAASLISVNTGLSHYCQLKLPLTYTGGLTVFP